MKIKWLLGYEDINFKHNTIWFAVGARGTGKSTLLEHLALQYLKNGYSVFDMFGSRDGEGLAWIRAPEAKDKKILLLKSKDVYASFRSERKNVSFLNWEDFRVGVLEEYDIIISASLLYQTIEEEFQAVNFYIDQIYRNPIRKRKTFMIIREAGNLLYARMKLNQNIQSSKGEMAYLVRESRHCNLSLGFDTQKRETVDAEIRSVVDYFLFTAQGSESLPRSLWFLYKYIKPFAINRLPRGSFAVLTRRGNIGLGAFAYHTWHKEGDENILGSLGMTVSKPEISVSEILESAKEVDKKPSKEEFTHVQVVMRFNDGEKLAEIGKSFGKDSNWARKIINAHNKEVVRNGYCPICSKLKNGLETQILLTKKEEEEAKI
jgi:energy-coupling factor transporter ATP-binding protein EcfA2